MFKTISLRNEHKIIVQLAAKCHYEFIIYVANKGFMPVMGNLLVCKKGQVIQLY